jgi:hypothetical protein
MSVARRAACLLLAIGLAACSPALHEPFSADELRRPGGNGAHEVDALLDEAATLYARRDREAVQAASDLWLRAAAADPARVEGLLGATRAQIWIAGHASDPDARDQAAVAAVRSSQTCLEVLPDDPRCKYWLALSIGVQARERRSTALDALPLMIDLLEQVIAARPELDHAGPDRTLALVLLRAPGWPTGPGDVDRGLERAREAVRREPDYPPNQLCLGEALGATGDAVGSRGAYARARDLARGRMAERDTDAREWLDEAEAALAGTGAR